MSRSTLRTLLVGAVAGFLIGGVTAVVTPAGAALATDWAKIFKQEIKPRADRRYVTKANAAKAYAPRLRVIRGTFVVAADTAAKDELLMTPISFGYALDPAPKVSVVHVGGTLPVGCSETGPAPTPRAAISASSRDGPTTPPPRERCSPTAAARVPAAQVRSSGSRSPRTAR